MLYKMNKPSENMNLSEVEINRMMHEQAVEDYNNEQERKKLKESWVISLTSCLDILIT